jgi:enoyl-[acyl-carrier protein] reductase II
MYEGNLDEGELEIGQVSALLHSILPAAAIVKNMWTEFKHALDYPLNKYNFIRHTDLLKPVGCKPI